MSFVIGYAKLVVYTMQYCDSLVQWLPPRDDAPLLQ